MYGHDSEQKRLTEAYAKMTESWGSDDSSGDSAYARATSNSPTSWDDPISPSISPALEAKFKSIDYNIADDIPDGVPDEDFTTAYLEVIQSRMSLLSDSEMPAYRQWLMSK